MSAWFEACQLPEQFGRPEQPPEVALAVRAWNLMGGEINWSALDPVSEMLGYAQPEILIAQLTAIRDHQRQEAS